jgi:predicted rRNA methylase YqxC with S4 and FtsJ domains
VKPMFELALADLPNDDVIHLGAVEHAEAGLVAAGWRVRATMRSPMRGHRGAVEYFIHAIRTP